MWFGNYSHALSAQLWIDGKGGQQYKGGLENNPSHSDNYIKYCHIFCLISTRSSIPPLIKHIILLPKVSLIYTENNLDILSSRYRDFIIPGARLENLSPSRV